MLYDLLEFLLGPLLTKQEQKMPKCRTCKKRMEQMGPPQLFLLPVYSDGRYSASADYFKENCVPIQREEEIPPARRVGFQHSIPRESTIHITPVLPSDVKASTRGSRNGTRTASWIQSSALSSSICIISSIVFLPFFP